MKWDMEYEDFYERWLVTDGARFFRTYDYEDAKWLCAVLNRTIEV